MTSHHKFINKIKKIWGDKNQNLYEINENHAYLELDSLFSLRLYFFWNLNVITVKPSSTTLLLLFCYPSLEVRYLFAFPNIKSEAWQYQFPSKCFTDFSFTSKTLSFISKVMKLSNCCDLPGKVFCLKLKTWCVF